MRALSSLAFAALLALLTGCPAGAGGDELGTQTAGSDTSGDELGTDGSDSDSAGDEAETGPPPDLPGGELGDCERLEQLIAALLDEADPQLREQLVADFLRTVSYGARGFPIVEGDTLAVFHRGEPGQALAVAGDFNDWQADAYVLDEPLPGIYYGKFELDAPPTGLYKLQVGDSYFADPLARRFGWDEFGEYSQIDAIPGRSHHERWPDFDEAVGALAPRDLTVYLPADLPALGEGPAEFTTLYMHDGQNLFSPEALFGGWQVGPTLDGALADGLLDPLIVVGVDNTAARFDEYTPVTDIIDGQEVGGQAEAYADFLVDGVVPFIESRYPAAADPQARAVMGSSLGGLVSLYIGLRHPDRFAAVASMSGTIDWGSFEAQNPTIRELYQQDPPLGLRVYLDSGGDEGLGCPGDGSDNYCGNLAFADDLRGLGWVDELDLFYRWDPGAPHNEAAWAERLLPALLAWL